MADKREDQLTYSDVTPKGLYMGRRNFLLGLLVVTGAVYAWKKYKYLLAGRGDGSLPVPLNGVTKWPDSTDEKVSSLSDVTHYNNYYEFGTDKEDPAANSKNFKTSPWTVTVEGEVKNKRQFSMDEILKLAPLEERIYRHRCVEGWSIVVPWIGYSFSNLAQVVEPTAKAKYVAFESYFDAKQMPAERRRGLSFPMWKDCGSMRPCIP